MISLVCIQHSRKYLMKQLHAYGQWTMNKQFMTMRTYGGQNIGKYSLTLAALCS